MALIEEPEIVGERVKLEPRGARQSGKLHPLDRASSLRRRALPGVTMNPTRKRNSLRSRSPN